MDNNARSSIEAFLLSGAVPARPRLAASVALLRDGDTGIEVCLLKRPDTMVFGPGMYVFPGGSVDTADYCSSVLSSAFEDYVAGFYGCSRRDARGVVTAGVRETFEEAGTLLGTSAGNVTPPVSGMLAAARSKMLTDERPMSELFAEWKLELSPELLKPWSRWVTPEWRPKRFDAYLFVARMPPGQQVDGLIGEVQEARWMPLTSALNAYRAKSIPMMTATVSTIRDLAKFRTVDEVMNHHREAATPVMIRARVKSGLIEQFYLRDGAEAPVSELLAPLDD